MHNIALALQIYHGVEGCFPPAYIADETGKPIHSWRVLILPYIEQQALYDLYSFDEPWDGPNNRKLHKYVIEILRCPSDDRATATDTSYVAVVRKGTMWPGSTSTRLQDARDGTSQTLQLVECAASGIHWMEPRDLDIDTMPLTINTPKKCGCCSEHRGGAQVSFVDGSVRFSPDTIAPQTLRNLIECDDGNPVTIP